jgi:transcriptional regulator with XRE-family HTH domain
MVGERLAELREQKALTLRELEGVSGVGADAISKIENGHRKPRPSTLRKLARALGVEVEEFFREPVVPLDEAPRGAGQPQASTKTVEEFEDTLARVREPGRAEALREHQAARRLVSSEGMPQRRIVDPPEAEIGKRFVEEFPPEERPIAFAEVVIDRERFELANANLEANYTRARELLRERDEKIAQLEEENARLRQETVELRAELAGVGNS